jgi:hypothetical protein
MARANCTASEILVCLPWPPKRTKIFSKSLGFTVSECNYSVNQSLCYDCFLKEIQKQCLAVGHLRSLYMLMPFCMSKYNVNSRQQHGHSRQQHGHNKSWADAADSTADTADSSEDIADSRADTTDSSADIAQHHGHSRDLFVYLFFGLNLKSNKTAVFPFAISFLNFFWNLVKEVLSTLWITQTLRFLSLTIIKKYLQILLICPYRNLLPLTYCSMRLPQTYILMASHMPIAPFPFSSFFVFIEYVKKIIKFSNLKCQAS